jgi:S-disulfanyl-L-cysteine oxidoreductase SoxD
MFEWDPVTARRHAGPRAAFIAWAPVLRSLVLGVGLLCGPSALADNGHRLHYGIGHRPSDTFIKDRDTAIGPDGAELPPGSGTVAAGAKIYTERCAMCHGASGREGPDPVLVGGRGTLASARPLLTIGSYWPYATTLYDYIYRAMPFVAPGSLAPDAVYALCAFLLNANEIIAADAVMDRVSLPAVHMPNRDGFVTDPRPDAGSSVGSR